MILTGFNPNTVLSEEVKYVSTSKCQCIFPLALDLSAIINNKDVNLCMFSDHLARSQAGTIVEKMSSGWDSLLVVVMSTFGSSSAFDIQTSILFLVALSYKLPSS